MNSSSSSNDEDMKIEQPPPPISTVLPPLHRPARMGILPNPLLEENRALKREMLALKLEIGKLRKENEEFEDQSLKDSSIIRGLTSMLHQTICSNSNVNNLVIVNNINVDMKVSSSTSPPSLKSNILLDNNFSGPGIKLEQYEPNYFPHIYAAVKKALKVLYKQRSECVTLRERKEYAKMFKSYLPSFL